MKRFVITILFNLSLLVGGVWAAEMPVQGEVEDAHAANRAADAVAAVCVCLGLPDACYYRAGLAHPTGGTDTLLVIDVRDVAEYKSGHVPGAINIPQRKLERQLDQLLDADGVVLYCINGRRTRLAEQTLIENDVPNVFHWRVTSWTGGMSHDIETQEVA